MQMQEHVLSFKVENQNQGEVYIDIAKAMSICGRRLFRQQGLWHVHGVCTYADVIDAADPLQTIGVPYTVSISGAPRNWVTRNSLVKAFEKWKDQQAKAYDAQGSDSFKPKWQDFKVWLNQNHYNNGDLLPVSGHMFGASPAYIAGQWDHSQFVIEEGMSNPGVITEQTPELHILGPDNGYTTMGLINAYQESRALPQSPDPLVPAGGSTNLYALSEDALADQDAQIVADQMTSGSREPPYDLDQYPGGEANGIEPILYSFGANSSTAKRKLSLNGFAAPNGLIEIQFDKKVGPEGQQNTGVFWIQLFVSHREAY